MNRIAQLRKEKAMSQIALAMKLNVSQKMISAYENNKNEPSVATLIKLADIFNTSVDYLVGNTDVRQPLNKFIEKGLTSNECELLNLYRSLPAKQQNIAVGVIIGLKNSP